MRLINIIPILLILCAGFTQAQQQQSMDAALKSLGEMTSKMPTMQQADELQNELKPKQEVRDSWVGKASVLEKKIDDANGTNQGFKKAPTSGDVASAIAIHKGSRAALFDVLDVYQRWAQRYGRMGCVRQVQNAKSFLTVLSNKWLTELAGMPLADELERGLSAAYITDGKRLGAGFGEIVQTTEIVSVCNFGGDEKDPQTLYHKAYPGEK